MPAARAMMPGMAWFATLPVMLVVALIAWLVATLRHNVGLVDIFWSLFVVAGAMQAFIAQQMPGGRATLVLGLALLWALRLAIHLLLRNWNAAEDHRYQAIRERNSPGFAWKSLYLVFGLQALLAFVVTAPLYAAISAGSAPLTALDLAGAVLVLAGILIEAVADAQLTAFRADPASRGQVLQCGLWRYSRHPNYFGEFCVWWGFFVIAVAAGSWWTVVSPLLMSVLLLWVSGVTLLEKHIGVRRPAYADYAARTNAFFPGPRRAR